jgi:hypothetical protein
VLVLTSEKTAQRNGFIDGFISEFTFVMPTACIHKLSELVFGLRREDV